MAKFTKSSGVRIPLLSDEECKAREIERTMFPPFKTWTPEQQEAGRQLGEILARMAVKQAYRAVVRHLEIIGSEGYTKDDFEKEAVRRALSELRAGKWKAGRGETWGLQDAMCWALESLQRDLNEAKTPATSGE